MQIPATLLALNERLKRDSPVYMVLVALVIGLLAGYGAVGFRLLIKGLTQAFWATPDFSEAWVMSLPWWVVILVPTAGMAVTAAIVHRFAREAKGHGVPEVMEAVALRQGVIRPRVVVAKAVASGVCIASGGSVGREGPIVQIGSALGSTVGQLLKMGTGRMRTLVGCGAAAGIAATFNAPVAGALFAVEILLGDFGVPQFSPIVISSVAATVVSRHYLGDFPAFELPPYSFVNPVEFIAYGVLGLLAGLLAYVFTKLLYGSEDFFDGINLPVPVKAAIGGALVGGLALVVPGVLGVGYEAMNLSLAGSPTAWVLLGLLAAKVVAVCITLGSGGSGGVFAPSLFMGAALGALVGTAAEAIIPGQIAPHGAYALVGMGAVVAAGTHAPITAILMIFELTGNYKTILPLMAACIIGSLMAMKLSKESIYTLKLMRRGVNIRAGQDVNLLRNIPVRDVLRTEVPRMAPNEGLTAMMARAAMSDAACFYIVDADEHVQGLVSMAEIRTLLQDADVLAPLVVAEDIAVTHFPAVSADDTLDSVLQSMQQRFREELPVLDDGKLVGLVHLGDVLGRYQQELSRRQMMEGL